MKLVWQIIKKDIVHQRWGLVLLVLLFAAQVALGVCLIRAFAETQRRDFVAVAQYAASGLVVLQAVLCYILVARLVQADGLVGSNQFWPTRPISSRRLLLAKVSGALLMFGLLPVLLLLPWWIYCHLSLPNILWLALETFSWQLLVIAPAFVVASLTDDLGRVLVWTVVLIMTGVVWGISFLPGLAAPLMGALDPRTVQGAHYTRLGLAVILLTGGAGMLVAHQFLTRRLVRSVIFVIAGIAAVALAVPIWRWNLMDGLARVTQPAPPAYPAMAVTLKFAAAHVLPYRYTEVPPRSWIQEVLLAENLPAGLRIDSASSTQTWTWPDGPSISRDSGSFWTRNAYPVSMEKAFGISAHEHDAETGEWARAQQKAIKQAGTAAERARLNDRYFAKLRANGFRSFLPVEEFWHPEAWSGTLTGSVSLPKSLVTRMREQPPAYVGRLEGTVSIPEVLVELPLRDGVNASFDSTGIHFGRLTFEGDQTAFVRLAVTTPAMSRNGLWFSGFAFTSRTYGPRGTFIAVNRPMNDYGRVEGNQAWDTGHLGALTTVQVGGILVGFTGLSVVPEKVIRQGKWILRDPEWVAHTKLLLVTDKITATFSSQVTADQFVLDPEGTDRTKEALEKLAPPAKN